MWFKQKGRKTSQWFCNRPLTPTETPPTPPDSNLVYLQDVTVTSSDDSIKQTNTSPKFQEELPESDLSDDSNSINDPEYIPSSNSSLEDKISETSDSSDSDIRKILHKKAAPKKYFNTKENTCDNYPNVTSVLFEEVTPLTEEIRDQTANYFQGKTVIQNRKKQFCYYCESSVFNFARHIFRNHSSEIEVQKILSLKTGSKQRKELLCSLRKKGNFLENSEAGKPVREGIETTNYLPCTHCLGFYSSKNLWRHRKKCSENPHRGQSSKFCQIDAQNFLIRQLRIDPELKEKVFPHMRADKISLTAKKDALICAFGARYLKTHRDQHFISVTSRKMREIAKLLLEFRKLKPSITTLLEALKPQYFDLLVTATKNVAKYNINKQYYESPTYAINMGTTLKQCCDIALMYALKKQNIYASVSTAEAQAEIKTLIQLLEAHWRFDISSQASNDLNSKKWNKITLIPLASDLKLVKNYLIQKANTAVISLQNDSDNHKAYIILLETIYCRLVLLNRKRPGELQRFVLRTYEESLKNDNHQTYEEFSEVVSETEKILMKSLKRVVIRGKRGRGVPVLFSKDVQEHLKILLKYRHRIIKEPNLYLFGNPNSKEPITGYKVLKKYAVECGAKNPKAITCTRLRKHLATLTQLFSMSENDMEQLASFMGHTLSVHRSSYRLPDDIYQTAKISKLLLLMEKGDAIQFRGKNFDEINIDLEEDLMQNTKEENITENVKESTSLEDTYNNVEILDENRNCNQENVSKANVNRKKKRILMPWTEEQKNVAILFFKKHIENKKPPKRSECEKLLEMNSKLFKNKDWLKIKVLIQNKYTNKYK